MSPYETLISAASGMIGTGLLNEIDNVSLRDAEAFVASNRECLQSARNALNELCSILVKNEAVYYDECLGDIQLFRRLAYAFQLQMRIAESQANIAEAAQIAVEVLELSNVFRRGGLILDFLVAIAIASLGTETLRRHRQRLDSPTRAKVIDAIARIERERETFDVIAERDRDWEIAVGWHDQPIDVSQLDASIDGEKPDEAERAVRECIESLINLPRQEKNSMHAGIEKRHTAMLRMLAVDLAIRSYHAARSSYPDDLETLVPSHLAELPLDPFTDRPFVYRKQPDDSFLLYSPGPSRIDHGAVFGHWLMVDTGQADYCLDTGDYELDCCSISSNHPGFISRIGGSILWVWRRFRLNH